MADAMTADEKLARLESWAVMAAEELQDFCNDAQISAGNPDGEDQLQGTRQLLRELDEIIMPDWIKIIADESTTGKTIVGLNEENTND